MSKAKSGGADSASAASASSSLTKILDVHERMETQCGEIYVQFAAAFSGNPELRRMWTAMALEATDTSSSRLDTQRRISAWSRPKWDSGPFASGVSSMPD